MMMPGRRTIRLPALLAIGMPAGCASQRPFQDLPAGAPALATRIVRGSAMSAARWVRSAATRGTRYPSAVRRSATGRTPKRPSR